MTSKNPWKALKQLGNNSSPPFQFVLHDELAANIHARALGPDPPPKKKRGPKAKHIAVETASSAAPSVEQLRIPEGVFASEGTALQQVDLQTLGASTVGVVLVNPAQAEPYLRLARPVSQGALALIIVGEGDFSGATVQVETLRFRAELVSTGEPLLVQGTLAQIGDKWVSRHVPKTTPVDIAKSVVARVAVYRDSLPVPWDRFTQSPLREIVSQVPLLQVCEVAGCDCNKWHGVADPGEPPAILETWGRQFSSAAFKPVAPASAEVFNVMLRIPEALELPLQSFSGAAGIFIEPRADGVRLPSDRFSVIWPSKATYQEALLLMQTHRAVCGLARIGERFGVRCLKTDEEPLHRLLRPSVAWVDRSKLRVFESGPWPFGTQRQAIVRALGSFGWKARPSQPCPGHRGGLWYFLEAEEEPPQKSIHAAFGEVLLWEVPPKEVAAPAAPPIVASQRTLKGLAPQAAATGHKPRQDPLQVLDPWQVALDQRQVVRPNATLPGASSVSRSMLTSGHAAADIEAAILAKVDSRINASQETLRKQLDSRITDSQESVRKQLGALDDRVTSVAQKVDSQESLLQGLFEQQMSRIEELIGSTKRGRNE